MELNQFRYMLYFVWNNLIFIADKVKKIKIKYFDSPFDVKTAKYLIAGLVEITIEQLEDYGVRY